MPFARVFVIFLLCFCSVLNAKASKLDSLLNVLSTAKEDTNKVILLQNIYLEQRRQDPSKAMQYAEMAMDLSRKLGYQRGIGNALNSIGSLYWLRGEMDKAREAYDSASAIYTRISDKKGLAISYNGRGLIAWKTGKHALAVNYFLESMKIHEALGNKKDVARAYANIAIVYMEQEKYDQALEHFSKALPVYEESKDPVVAGLYNNMARIYSVRKDYKKAEEYLLLAIKLNEEMKDIHSLAMAYSNFGNLLYDQGKNNEALKYYMKAMKMQEELGDKRGTAVVYNNIGQIYEKQGDYPKAILFQEKALADSREVGDKNAIMYALEGLARAYERQNNYPLALKFHKEYAQVKDSLFNLESSKQIADMDAKYQSEKKEKEIALLTKDKQIQEAEINKQMYLLYSAGGGLLLAIGLAFVIYRSYRQKHEANRLLNEKNMLIEEQHQSIKDSINYAKKIQLAILPSKEQIRKALPDHFILYLPKDVVSGDFYAFAERNGKTIIAAADCTGHGVPGAFMSMIGHDQLNHIIIERGITQPAEILYELNKGIRMALKQSDTAESKDGMDIALCALDMNTGVLEYAGAHRPLFLFNGQFNEVAPDKVAIGGFTSESYRFNSHSFQLAAGSTFYLFSDGFADQFGGEKGKKFMKGRFRELLESMHLKPMEEQERLLMQALRSWKGDHEQVDDVLVIGVRI